MRTSGCKSEILSLVLWLEITVSFSVILQCFIYVVFRGCPYKSLICIMPTCGRVFSSTQHYLLSSNCSTISFGYSSPLYHAISIGLPVKIPSFSHHRIGYKIQAWPVRLHHYLGLSDWLMDEIIILKWPIRALPWNIFYT